MKNVFAVLFIGFMLSACGTEMDFDVEPRIDETNSELLRFCDGRKAHVHKSGKSEEVGHIAGSDTGCPPRWHWCSCSGGHCAPPVRGDSAN